MFITKLNRLKSRGFTLVEILVTVGVIAILSGAGYMALQSNLNTVSQKAKLPQDVATMNRSVETYLASGGSLDGVTSPAAVLAKLKTRAVDRQQIAAVNGSMIDPRINVVTATGSAEEVAIWDLQQKVFRIVKREAVPSGTTAISEFKIDPNASFEVATENRQNNYHLAAEGNWIWDYTDQYGGEISRTLVRPSTAKSISRQAPATVAAARLLPPTFSLAAGSYTLSRFPASVQLLNPNPGGTSALWYSQNAAEWAQFGSPLTILPGASVQAYAATLNDEIYSDSQTTSAIYEAQKVTMQVGDNVKSSFRYGELGGALAPGSITPAPLTPGKLLLMNGAEFPDYWENHDTFQFFWTFDGGDPKLNGAGRRTGNNTFVTNYPGDEVAVSLTDFSTSASLTLQYFALAKNASVAISSNVTPKLISRAPTPLLPPLITPGTGSLDGTDPVAMILDLTGGQTPAGARIYYRSDGVDPGAGQDPNPGAIEYNGTFLPAPNTGPVAAIGARVYAPVGYKDWFVTSPVAVRTYFLPYADKNIYAVTGTDTSTYVVDPNSGSTQLINSTAPFNMRTMALDAKNAALYYTETAGSGWRLGRYDIISQVHTILGSLATGRTYNATQQPENLTFYNDNLYYIARQSDDLIKISLSTTSPTAITTVSKLADITTNTTSFATVGDMAVDDNGWMFFGDDVKRHHRFNLITMSGYKRIGDTELVNDALAIYQGLLYAGGASTDDIRRISPAVGTTLSKVTTAPVKRFADFGSPTSSNATPASSSLWMIVDHSDGPHLHQLRNYRSPVIAADVDFGVLNYLSGTTVTSMNAVGQGYIKAMCITSAGVMYFCRNFKTTISGTDYYRPIMKLNISNLSPGDTLAATFVGDLKTSLTTIAGTIDPDDVVTGITISPGGQLYGVLREGLNTGAGAEDYLFRVTQTVASMAGPNLPVTLVGRLTSPVGSSTQSEDLTFGPDGRLYVSDISDDTIYTVDPVNGSILSNFGTQTNGNYLGLAVDPLDYRMIGSSSSTSTPANSLMKVDGSSENDDQLIDMGTLFGFSNVEAMAFFQGTFVLAQGEPDLYAVDGTETIYGVDIDTGATSLVTDAPFRLRALAYDFVNRRLFYLRNNAGSMTIGSYSLITNTHTSQGSLKDWWHTYKSDELPDNLCYFGGSLWYVPPRTDDLVKIQIDSTGAVVNETKAADLSGNTLSFDLIGDLAVAPDGWMYFTATNFQGQRFCRYRLPMLANFEVLSGPSFPNTTVAAADFTELWFDALAFRTVDGAGNRPLYGTFAAASAPLRTVSTTNGSSTLFKPLNPSLQVIDFSDFHPGAMGSAVWISTPVLAINNLRTGYTYANVGGPFLTGTTAAPAVSAAPNIILVNSNQIPLTQQNSSTFFVQWTYDGSNPLTSSTAIPGTSFTNGMPAMPVAVDFAKWGSRTTLPLSAAAKSNNALLMTDSPVVTVSAPIIKTQLRLPVFTLVTTGFGTRTLEITGNINAGDCPPGTRIYYTTDGTDPGLTTDSSGMEIPSSAAALLYNGAITPPNTGTVDFIVTARAYPPSTLGSWFSTSISDYIAVPVGIAGGHMDMDTSHLLYAFRQGTTDGHIHEYDKVYNVVGESYFNFKSTTLKNIPVYVASGVKFKIIVANANLSPGGRLVINQDYNSGNPATWIPVTTYDDTALSALPIYSLNGIAGTTQLTKLGIYFDTDVIAQGGLIPTVTGSVRKNIPGLLGEWRNGALTIQLVLVNSNGTNGFTTNTGYSNGGVQGVATTGLLWESTVFYHWSGAAYGL